MLYMEVRQNLSLMLPRSATSHWQALNASCLTPLSSLRDDSRKQVLLLGFTLYNSDGLVASFWPWQFCAD